GASNGPRHRPQVPHLPAGRHEALPQRRALPDREVRDRAPVVSAGRARPWADQAERVPPAAAREAEGAPLLRPAREAISYVLHEGRQRLGRHGRGAAADARDARSEEHTSELQSLAYLV